MSSAYTRPFGPTRRARRAVNQPPPAPRSATIDPSAMFSASMITSGLFQSTRSGASSTPMLVGGNRGVFGFVGCDPVTAWAERAGEAGGAGRERKAVAIAHTVIRIATTVLPFLPVQPFLPPLPSLPPPPSLPPLPSPSSLPILPRACRFFLLMIRQPPR